MGYSIPAKYFAHGTFPNAPYLLMIFPDRLYLWKNTSPDIDDIQPDYIIDARPILTPYFNQIGITEEQISGAGLELIIASWLSNLIHTNIERTDVAPDQRWIIESGLYDAVKGGCLDQEVVA